MTTPRSELSERVGRFRSVEVLGEMVLLAFVGATFAYMLWESRNWGTGAWLLPRITIFFGTPFWIWRVVALARNTFATGGSTQIMDTGFLVTDDPPSVVARRWVMLIATTSGLLFGIWLLGFHVMVPLYVASYLIFLGKVRWWIALLAASFYEAVIVGIYGELLLAAWNRPLVLDWFDAIRGVGS